MPLSPEQEWTLVACGLVAHADGILEAEEWEQVLWMVDERIDAEQTSTWVTRLQDAAVLRAHLASLPLPPPLFSEDILAKAWRMALADGRGSDTEVAVYDKLARSLGVDAAVAAAWRDAWTQQATVRSELIAGFAAHIATADGQVSAAERERFDALLGRLPLTAGTQGAMQGLLDEPPEMMMLIGGFVALQPEERRIAMLDLVSLVKADGRDETARAAFIDLAEAIAIERSEAEHMLDR